MSIRGSITAGVIGIRYPQAATGGTSPRNRRHHPGPRRAACRGPVGTGVRLQNVLSVGGTARRQSGGAPGQSQPAITQPHPLERRRENILHI